MVPFICTLRVNSQIIDDSLKQFKGLKSLILGVQHAEKTSKSATCERVSF